MDGYVSKPIQPERLWEVLATVVPDGTPPCVDESAAEEVWGDDAFRARCGGDAELIRELIELFFEEYPVLLADIRQAVRDADAAMLKGSAHKLKGTAGNFGAGRVVAAALRLEQMGAARQLDGAADACGELETALGQLHDLLAPWTLAGAAC